MNDHNNIINCTTVQWCIRYRETIGYIPTCIGKDVGRVFLDYPMIRCGEKHGQSFTNTRPLYLRRIIGCVLTTLQGIRFNEILSN